MEGTRPYEGGSNPPGAVLPLLELHHDDGSCAVTGGVVHRGAGLPALDGAYLFTDYCDGRLRAVRAADGRVVEERTFDAAADGWSPSAPTPPARCTCCRWAADLDLEA